MTQPLDTPMVCPVLVGRDGERDALRDCLDEVMAVRGRTVLVAGEAGIGKTRLVAEVAAYARERGVRVLVGQCFEPDRTQPFAPVLDLLRFALRQATEIVEPALADAAPEFARLQPDLELLVPGVVPAPPLGPQSDRRRAVQALTRFVATVAAERPLLLVIEDAHWSDEATLDALLHLARSLSDDCRTLLIVTYRGDEIGPEFDRLLVALDHDHLASTLRLKPLSAGDIAAMLRAMRERIGRLPTAIADRVTDLAEGNPFYVEELLRSALTGDEARPAATAVPRSVNDAVRARLERLGEDARSTLTHAAVAGRRFDFALLQALGGCDHREMLRRVKEVIRAGLVVEESADRFAFRHALTRQAIYAGLLSLERREMHQAVFDALRRLFGDERERGRHAADLAHHAFEAGCWGEALAYGRQAGEQALALYAPRAAAELFTRALAAADRLGLPASSTLHRQRGQAYDTLGDFEAVRRDFETAVALARAGGDRAAEGEGQLALGQYWRGRDYATAEAHLHAARDAAEDAGDLAMLARCLNQLGNWHVNLARPADAFRCHQDALAIFDDLEDQRGVAETLDLLGMARYLAGDMAGAAEAYRRAIPLLRALDDRKTLASALVTLALTIACGANRVLAPATGDDEEARRHAEEAIALSRTIGWLPGEAFALSCAAGIEGQRHPARALETARQGLRIAEDLGHAQWSTGAHYGIGRLHATLLDLPAAHQEFEQARRLAQGLGSSFWRLVTAADLASTLVERGDLAQAGEVLAAVLDDEIQLETSALRRAWYARAELARAQGDHARELDIVERLLSVAVGDSEPDAARTPYLAFMRGEALAGLGRSAEARAAFQSARAGAVALGAPFLLWRVDLAVGGLARRRGDQEEADRAYATARAAVDSLAASIDDEAQRETFLRNALRRFPPGRPPTQLKVVKERFGGLTRGERSVAALVAEGLSNREIGEALWIAETTVRTHVGNILGKLGLKSRTQIAVWAKEHGLTRADES